MRDESIALTGTKPRQASVVVALFVFITVITNAVLQYSFLCLAHIRFTGVIEMIIFPVLFAGIIMIVAWLVKRAAFPDILHSFGIRKCLIYPPVIISAGILMMLTIGTFSGMKNLDFLIILFIIAALSFILIYSVQVPAFIIIYHSFAAKSLTVSPRYLDSWLRPVPLFISGLFITLPVTFAGFPHSVLFYLLILMFPLLILLYGSFRIYDSYKKHISFLCMDEAEEIAVCEDALNHKFAGQLLFKSDYFNLISGDYSVLEKTNNKWYFEKIIDYSWSKKDINLLPVLKKASFIAELDEGIKKRSFEVLGILQKKTVYFKYADDKTAEAVKILSGTRIPQTSQILNLLRSNSIESKRLAILMIGKFRLNDLLSLVCDCLNTHGLTRDACEVLKSFGAEAEQDLIRFYLSSSGNQKLTRLVIHLLEKAGTGETAGFLFSRLCSNSRNLKEIILKYLIVTRFAPSQEEKKRLDHLASEVIGNLKWLISARISIDKITGNELLLNINSEIDRWKNFLFNIISVSYGRGTARALLQSTGDTTVEGVAVTLELTDILISPSLSGRLKALFDFPDIKKIRKLSEFYNGEISLPENLPLDILNGDYNLLSLWTKTTALKCICSLDTPESEQCLTALLFNPEEIIREEAARLIGKIKPELFYSASQRLPEDVSNRLEKIINKTTNEKELLFEKVQFLTRYFRQIPEDELLPLAAEMNYMGFFISEAVNPGDGYILWPLNSASDEVYILYDGETDILGYRFRDRHDLSFYFLPLSAIEEYILRFPGHSNEVLKYIDQNQT